ncbi:NAD(P)H-dependent oxidoreductase [Paenibacillus sp. YAF4_2]|uniref:NAD(P)H-dependent oxidoreductase n=1 Tax=Paenibacillus sp. YAF4_2 TaxID=3233085 RepID=UPI003F9A4304
MKVLVIASHPNLASSRANERRLTELLKVPDITVRHLDTEYPDYQIDVAKEQSLLLEHDRIILQFPFYWYSCPALLKKWLEDVLMRGWAYGPGGDKLKGKTFVLAITTGGTEAGYQAGGYNWSTISEYTKPLQATITRCNGIFAPSFVLHDVRNASDEDLERDARQYIAYITGPLDSVFH